jgi:tRNA-guanine family transglycosylase
MVALGGPAVGKPQAAMFEMIDAVVRHLPVDQPRYLMAQVSLTTSRVRSCGRWICSIVSFPYPWEETVKPSTGPARLICKRASCGHRVSLNSESVCTPCRRFSRVLSASYG